jgi:uncharacterized protein YbaP (TraB family)
MKKIITYCAVILILIGFCSCASSPASGQSGSSVWKVSKDGNSLFLGGSIHILRSGDFPLPKEFDRAFSQSSMLVLETDIEQLADESIAQYLLTRMILPGGKTLESILDSDTYEMLKVKCEEYGIPLDSVSLLKPSMIITILTMMEIQKSGFVQQGVDVHYLEKAKKVKKPRGFLETIEAQIDMLVTMGDGYENDYVKYSLYDMDNTENDLTDIVSEWRKGGASSTEEAILEMKSQWPVLYKTMLVDRNAAWLPQINEYLAGGSPVLVIVGLAHLHGPDGLLRQLAESGCTVEQFR